MAGPALAFSLLQEKRHSTTASLLFRDPGFDEGIFGNPGLEAPTLVDPQREAQTNVRLASLDVVADQTAEAGVEGSPEARVSEEVEVEEASPTWFP